MLSHVCADVKPWDLFNPLLRLTLAGLLTGGAAGHCRLPENVRTEKARLIPQLLSPIRGPGQWPSAPCRDTKCRLRISAEHSSV